MKSLFSLEQYTKIFPQLKRKLSESSQFGKKLNEYRKLRTAYGKPSQKYLQALFKKSNCPSQISLSFFRLLESRLDVVLYRAHFFESIATSKQQIRIGTIKVNNKKVVSPGYNVLPGDIIRVISRDKQKQEKELSSIVFQTGSKEHTFLKIKNRKKSGSRYQNYQKSPFLRELFTSQFEKAITFNPEKKKTEFKTKAIGKSFLYRLSKFTFKEFLIANLQKLWCFQNTPLVSFLFTLRKFSTKTKEEAKQNIIESEKKAIFKSKTDIFKNNFLSLLEISQNNDPLVMSNSLTNFQRSKIEEEFRFFYKETTNIDKYLSESAFLLNPKKKPIEISNWLFLNFALFLKKQTISTKKKLSCFFREKSQPFFKNQFFFAAKTTKPLHLEISYRSRSIIFLYPPQRVCFSTFIDLSQIYK